MKPKLTRMRTGGRLGFTGNFNTILTQCNVWNLLRTTYRYICSVGSVLLLKLLHKSLAEMFIWFFFNVTIFKLASQVVPLTLCEMYLSVNLRK